MSEHKPTFTDPETGEEIESKGSIYDRWLDAFIAIKEYPPGHAKVACPNCGQNTVDFQYVGNTATRVGYLDIWCNSCLKGIHLSRIINIPENEDLIGFDEPPERVRDRIPNFEQIVPSKRPRKRS